jgi:5-methylcytosine-specific restriction endonuclease McrA
VRDCNQYQIDPPPAAVILEELRQRWHHGQTHLHADHDIPIDVRPDLRLSLDNYRTRCNRCHDAKTMREQHLSRAV